MSGCCVHAAVVGYQKSIRRNYNDAVSAAVSYNNLRTKETETMNLHELMQFATAYSKLGWAIQEQLDDILKSDYSDLNPNALQEINERLRGYNEDLDIAIDEALEATAVRS